MPRPIMHWGNVGESRHKGAMEATGEIIVSTDADTTFPKNYLERIEKYFQDDPDLVGIGGPYSAVDPTPLNIFCEGYGNFFREYLADIGLPVFFCSNLAFTKAAFLKGGGYQWAGVGFYGPIEEWSISRSLQSIGKVIWDDSLRVYVEFPPRLQAAIVSAVAAEIAGVMGATYLGAKALKVLP